MITALTSHVLPNNSDICVTALVSSRRKPAAYFTRYWVNGVLLVEGQGRTTVIPELFNAGPELQTKQNVILATDHWPFLYLQNRSIPTSILVVSALFLLAAWVLLRRLGLARGMTNGFSYHFFFLGAGSTPKALATDLYRRSVAKLRPVAKESTSVPSGERTSFAFLKLSTV